MEFIAFTVVAIALYFFSDWILNRIEIHRGTRFEHRTLIFFAILLALAIVSFQLIQQSLAPVQ